jgi:integrase
MSLPAKTEAGRRPSRPPGRPFCSWLRQKRGRPLITFAAYSGMRPGEIFALEWPDIDFDAMRVDVKRPASLTCRSRTTPRRIALRLLPATRYSASRHARTVGWCSSQSAASDSRSRRLRLLGKGSSACGTRLRLLPRHEALHGPLPARDPRVPPRVIAEQMGWTLAGVLKLLAVHGHGDVGELEEIDRAFKSD